MTVDKEEFPSNTIREQRDRSRAKTRIPVRETEKTPGGEVAVKRNIPNRPAVTPRVRKQTFVSKMRSTFLGDDAGSVFRYVVMEVLIPAAKETIQDIVTKGIEMLLFGQSTGRDRKSSGRGRGTVISYGNYYRGTRSVAPDRHSEALRSPGFRSRLSTVVFDYEAEAEEILDFLVDLIEEYSQVSVADFYEVAGLSGYSEYTDNSWGWTNLSRARIVRTRDGCEIDFPEPRRLD